MGTLLVKVNLDELHQNVFSRLKEACMNAFYVDVREVLYQAVYQAVCAFVRASAAGLDLIVNKVLSNPTAVRVCQKAIELCIAALKKLDEVNQVIIDMLTEYSFELTSNLLKAVAAAKLAEVAATQLAEQSADAVATGAVAVDPRTIATKAFSNTLLSTTAISIIFLTGSITSSYIQLKRGKKTQDEHNRHVTKRAMGTAGSIAGTTTGVFVGTLIFPVVGTFVGGFLGGMLGNVAGSATGAAVYDELSARKKK